jgi:hypothetical protein
LHVPGWGGCNEDGKGIFDTPGLIAIHAGHVLELSTRASCLVWTGDWHIWKLQITCN